jgi:hypothetical protein
MHIIHHQYHNIDNRRAFAVLTHAGGRKHHGRYLCNAAVFFKPPDLGDIPAGTLTGNAPHSD